MVNRNGSNISRACIAKEDDGSLIVAGSLYTGEKVRIGYGNSKEILNKSQKILDATSQKPSETIFIYSCSTRKYFMGDEVEFETLPLQDIAPVSGFFTYGEFFTTNHKELFNQTMTLVSLSESDTISNTSKELEVEKTDIHSISMNGLSHLINVTTEEAKEKTKTLKATNKLNQEHKERMELAFKGTNEGIWDWNILDNSVYFSPRWKEMLGYKDEELINKVESWSDRLHPEDKDKVWEDIYKNVNTETEYYENIHRLKHRAGHWVWILDRGKTQYDESGKAVRMIGTHVDITDEKDNQFQQCMEEKQANINSASISGLTHLINITSKEVETQTETLKESHKLNQQLKERMELALTGSKTSVLDLDFTDNSLYISPSWKEMLGYTDEELPNAISTWADRVHRDDQKDVIFLLRHHQKNKIKYFESNHRLKHKDGHWIWVLGRAQILYDENGRKVRMIGTHTDITEEKELQMKYAQQAQIIEHIHDSIVSTDLEGIITSWNRGSEVLFGYKADEMIGKNISKVHPEEEYEIFKSSVDILMKEGKYRADMHLVKKSKAVIDANLSLSLLKDDKGKPIGMIGYVQDITERKKAETKLYEQKSLLHYQAHYDVLTGLPNRALFNDRLKQGIIKAKRHKIGLALFFIDLDKFKHINDSLGHGVGDSVLKVVANRLENILRKEDTLARLSGDEFTVIMEDLTHPEDASFLAEKILKTLAESMYIDDHLLYVSGSIGISLYPQDATDTDELLKYADTAMYEAKEAGRNNFQFYSSKMTKLALEHIVMKSSLQQAIDNKEFVIYYQPQINANTHTLVGLEALIRWKHPTMGLLLPNKFIPLAEETGMIVEIDRLVMHTAMKQIGKWYSEGLNPGVLALNLSIKRLESSGFFREIKKNINLYGFKPEWLELEITESQMMRKPKYSIAKLGQINDIGVGISIDDFGTGYSSLSFLKRLPINRLKIDQSFIKDIPNDEEDVAIVKAIIALAGALKLDLIAEGVETSEQKDFLVANGCINIQGYYYAYPMSAKDMKAMLLKNSYSSS